MKTKEQMIIMWSNFYQAYIEWWLPYKDISIFFDYPVALVKKCINLYLKSNIWQTINHEIPVPAEKKRK